MINFLQTQICLGRTYGHIYRQPRLGDALAFWPHPNFPSLSHALSLYKIYAKDKPFSCVFCEAVFSAKFAKNMHQNEYIGFRYVREYQSTTVSEINYTHLSKLAPARWSLLQ